MYMPNDLLTALAKKIDDLDVVLDAIALEAPRVKATSRTFVPSIVTAIDQMQVLRMLIAMEHSACDQVNAALAMRATLRLADLLASRSRLTKDLRAAIQLSRALSEQICVDLSSQATLARIGDA